MYPFIAGTSTTSAGIFWNCEGTSYQNGNNIYDK